MSSSPSSSASGGSSIDPSARSVWRNRWDIFRDDCCIKDYCTNLWKNFCHWFCYWDKTSRDVGFVMIPVTVFIILIITSALVLGGAFENKDPTLDDFLRLIIGNVRMNGDLLYPDVWDKTQQPDTPEAKAYQFLRNDDTTKKLVNKIVLRDHVTRADADRIQQRFVLASLYYATGGNNWAVNTNWLNESVHECWWYTTGDHRNCEVLDDLKSSFAYRNLSLRENNLRGKLPPYLLDFLSLHDLDLSIV
jgi:hypothetical protein